MNSRRWFIQKFLVLFTLIFRNTPVSGSPRGGGNTLKNGSNHPRPVINNRKFLAPSIENIIRKVRVGIKCPQLGALFENAYSRTLDYRIHFTCKNGQPYTTLIAENQEVMSLPSSTLNVWPYLPFINQDNALKRMIQGCINWQMECIVQASGKEECILNSLPYCILLAYQFWKITGESFPSNLEWHHSISLWVKAKGLKVGMNKYPLSSYSIPEYLLTRRSIECLAILAEKGILDKGLAEKCRLISKEMGKCLESEATFMHPKWGKIFAYERDGNGNQVFMDTAHFPSLLSLPYLNLIAEKDLIYCQTRSFLWTENNPYFFKGPDGEGLGSPQMELNKIHPISLIYRALTSIHEPEIRQALTLLLHSASGSGALFSSFEGHNAGLEMFNTEPWREPIFGELILKIYLERPHLLQLDWV